MLGPRGYFRGDSADFVPFRTPIGEIRDPLTDFWYVVTLYPQVGRLLKTNLPGDGMIWYSLTRISQPNPQMAWAALPAGAQEPNADPNNVRWWSPALVPVWAYNVTNGLVAVQLLAMEYQFGVVTSLVAQLAGIVGLSGSTGIQASATMATATAPSGV